MKRGNGRHVLSVVCEREEPIATAVERKDVMKRVLLAVTACLALTGAVPLVARRRRKHEGGCAPDTPGSGRGNGRRGHGPAGSRARWVPPFTVFPNADYQTGGTGLRNQRKGGITINGVPRARSSPRCT